MLFNVLPERTQHISENSENTYCFAQRAMSLVAHAHFFYRAFLDLSHLKHFSLLTALTHSH